MRNPLFTLGRAAVFLAMFAAVAGCSPTVQEKVDYVLGTPRNPAGIPLVPDTGSMNAERFGDQTYPVFWRHSGMSTEQAYYPVQTSTRLRTGNVGLPQFNKALVSRYGQLWDDGRVVSAIPYQRVDPRLYRQVVTYETNERPGTIVVDRKSNYLYFIEPGGKAIRYGVGLGRQGFAWSGRGTIHHKRKWPHWTPTDEMVANDVDLKPVSADRGGMVAGVNNPLGARALYIYQGGRDTLYRVHGTPDWLSVGKKTSSGCVRMFNQDVIDLFDRVRDGTTIVVM